MTEREELFDYITDLLINFDEMGFGPTVPCPDLEAYAIRWRQQITDALEDYCKQDVWISVEERLPDKGGYYLICQKSDLWCDHVIQTARWNNTAQKFRGAQAGCFMEYVTHWMPLPEVPNMKGGEGE